MLRARSVISALDNAWKADQMHGDTDLVERVYLFNHAGNVWKPVNGGLAKQPPPA